MLTQQQSVRPGPVQSHVTAVQPAGAKTGPVPSIRASSTAQAKSAVAADLSPIALTNLSPDSFFGRCQDPQNQDGSLGPYSQRYYVYKANDTLIIGGADGAATVGAYLDVIPTGNNVSIQATNLLIATSITIPQADIQIYCRHMAVPAGVTVTIDASATGKVSPDSDESMAKANVKQAAEGQPGQNGGTVAAAWAQDIANATDPKSPPADILYGTPIDYPFGQNGENGGNITIICDELQLDGTLILNANGRNGYSGCPGQPGGSVATGQTAGQGGDGQGGGVGGNGGTVTFQYRTLSSGNIANLQTNASSGQPGLAGTVGPGGSPNGATGGSPPGSASGFDGSTNVSSFTDASLLGQTFDEIYLLKAVETAKLQYMLNEPMAFSPDPVDNPGYDAARDMLVWLQSVLSGYVTLGGSASDSDHRKNNLYLIASTYCARITHIPPLTSAGNLASSIPGWTFELGSNNLTYIQQTYLPDGEKTWGDLQNTYTNYGDELNKLNQAENLAEAIQAQYQTFQNAANSYKATYDALSSMLAIDPSNPTKTIAGQLRLASTALQDDFNNLSPILAQVQTTIANHYDCNVQNVLSTLSQAVPQMLFMAATPELMPVMAAASAGPLILDGINQITDDSGKAIDKSQIITDLKNAPSISDIKGDLLNSDGSLKSSTTFVLSQLNTLADDISSLSDSIDNDNKNSNGNPTPVAEQAVAAIETLKQAIINKSQLQLQYQSYAAAAATAWKDWQDAQNRGDQLEKTDPSKMPTPDLLGHVSHLAMLVQKGLTEYIALESQFKRFAAWLSLDNTEDPDLTQTATNLTSYWSQGSAPSPTDLQDISDTMSTYEQNLSDYFTNAGSPTKGSPANANPSTLLQAVQPDLTQRPNDLVVSITSDYILNIIRQGAQQSQFGTPVTFIIVPTGVAAIWGGGRGRKRPQQNKDGTTTYFYRNDTLGLVDVPMVEFSGSIKFYDLRAYYAQPRIIGATYNGTKYTGKTLPLPNRDDPKPQSISVNIHAPATRWFWGSANPVNKNTSPSTVISPLIFTHPNGRDGIFEHYYLTTPDDTANDVSGDNGGLDDPTLPPLGIYGPWTICLSPWSADSDPNAQIDFSTVTQIQLGFAGTARVIPENAALTLTREHSTAHAA
jgi:hypothetical protein